LDNPELDSFRREDAKARFAEDEAEIDRISKQVEAFSLASMRAPAVVAAGGFAATLGFYSANAGRFIDPLKALDALNATIEWLLFSIFLTLLSPCLAYLSQAFYLESSYLHRRDWTHPYVFSTPGSMKWWKAGEFCRGASTATVAGSIGALVFAAVDAATLFASALVY
jgi:hypothetical protein